jgi:hypothetical protein
MLGRTSNNQNIIDGNSLKFLKVEGAFLHEGGLYFISRQNGSKLVTHFLIDANETEVETGGGGGGGVKKKI